MKKNTLKKIMTLTLTFVVAFIAMNSSQKAYAKIALDLRFKDYKFYNCVKEAVGPSGVSSDGVTLKDSALNNLYYLECRNRNISDVTGLDLMKNLMQLELGNNQIEKINVKALTKLEIFQMPNNNVWQIDLSYNTNLTTLSLGGNGLISIDLSKNQKLLNLALNNNHLKSINLKNNPKLESVILNNNDIKTIDLSKNKKLHYIALEGNLFSAKPKRCLDLGEKCTFGYLIKFDINGGSSASDQLNQNGYYALMPINPTRPGYEFLGWYKENILYDFDNQPLLTSNIKLVAKWKKIPLAKEEETTDNSNRTTIIAIVVGVLVVACLLMMSSKQPTTIKKTTKKRASSSKTTTARKSSTAKRTGTKKSTSSKKKK